MATWGWEEGEGMEMNALQKDMRKLVEVMHIFMILIVVMMHHNVQTHQIVYFNV